MPITQQGSLNTTALVVPGLYVQIVPPQNLVLNGVPSNLVGMVGTATWGPVNQATVIGSTQACTTAFGPLQNRTYDLGTHVAVAGQQGANAFVCVRVTDGTDTAAAATVLTNCLTLTAKYTGALGNSITVTIAAGAKASSYSATIGVPGQTAEQFQNITGSGNAFWVALAAAINNGNAVRGPSNFVVATAGVGTTAPSAATYTLSGGTDGVSSVTATTLLGSDSATPRTGMYALRGQGCSLLDVCDAYTSTVWTTIDTFAQSEGMYSVISGPSGDNISNAVTIKSSVGLDSYTTKLMFGDWLYWIDTVNSVTRLVSPVPFIVGRLANLSPEQSSLNKPIQGVVGSQKQGALGAATAQVYAYADLQTLFTAGIDVIMNPSAGGTYWAAGLGHNSSSNQAINGDNYTRLTNYIAATLYAGMGKYVGQVINASLFQRVRSTLMSFLQNMLTAGQLGSTTGALPFSVQCDTSNNPTSLTSLNYLTASVSVQYQGINEKFIVNLQGGQTVQIIKATGTSAVSGLTVGT